MGSLDGSRFFLSRTVYLSLFFKSPLSSAVSKLSFTSYAFSPWPMPGHWLPRLSFESLYLLQYSAEVPSSPRTVRNGVCSLENRILVLHLFMEILLLATTRVRTSLELAHVTTLLAPETRNS